MSSIVFFSAPEAGFNEALFVCNRKTGFAFNSTFNQSASQADGGLAACP
jgi:hypothetical protein